MAAIEYRANIQCCWFADHEVFVVTGRVAGQMGIGKRLRNSLAIIHPAIIIDFQLKLRSFSLFYKDSTAIPFGILINLIQVSPSNFALGKYWKYSPLVFQRPDAQGATFLSRKISPHLGLILA